MAFEFNFPEIIENLVQQGFYQYVLPSVAVFVISYAILVRSKIVHSNLISAVISGIFALFFMFFAASVQEIGAFFGSFLARVGIVLIIVLTVLMIYKFVHTAV